MLCPTSDTFVAPAYSRQHQLASAASSCYKGPSTRNRDHQHQTRRSHALTLVNGAGSFAARPSVRWTLLDGNYLNYSDNVGRRIIVSCDVDVSARGDSLFQNFRRESTCRRLYKYRIRQITCIVTLSVGSLSLRYIVPADIVAQW